MKNHVQRDYKLEACVESLDEVLHAAHMGADQLELCANLDEDGTTPLPELTATVIQSVPVPVKVMIRPRPGDFIYTDHEVRQMDQSIRHCKSIGVEGIVLGALTHDFKLDLKVIRHLAESANPLPVTIHKAIDLTRDPISELRHLKYIPNVRYILSSGCKSTALEGAALLREMIAVAGSEITIIPAGKITASNLELVHKMIDAEIYHGRRIV